LMPKLSDMSLIVSGFNWFIVFMIPLSLCKGKSDEMMECGIF
jgi:hypothetical protein